MLSLYFVSVISRGLKTTKRKVSKT